MLTGNGFIAVGVFARNVSGVEVELSVTKYSRGDDKFFEVPAGFKNKAGFWARTGYEHAVLRDTDSRINQSNQGIMLDLANGTTNITFQGWNNGVPQVDVEKFPAINPNQ